MNISPGEARLKRLSMRSWRRGTKEMDMILGPFSDARLATLDAQALDAYEALLHENDQDLYRWVSGAEPAAEAHRPMIEIVAAFHDIRRETGGN